MNKKNYIQDENKKWWYQPPNMKTRYGAEEFFCLLCGKKSLKVKGKRNNTESIIVQRRVPPKMVVVGLMQKEPNIMAGKEGVL